MTRQEYTERFCTPSAPGGCTTLMLIEIVRLESEVERLKKTEPDDILFDWEKHSIPTQSKP